MSSASRRRVAGVVELVAQRAPFLVLVLVRPLDQANAGPVVAHDALAHGALGLERRQPLARHLQLAAQVARLRGGAVPDLPVELLLALLELVDPGGELGAVGLRLRALVGDASREGRALGLALAQRVAQPLELEPQLAVLPVAVAARGGSQQQAAGHQEPRRRAQLAEPACDPRPHRRACARAHPRGRLQHLLARVVGRLEPQPGPAGAELDHVAFAQHRLVQLLARKPQHELGRDHLRDDLAVALEDARVVQRRALRLHVGVRPRADERGQRHLGLHAAGRPGEPAETHAHALARSRHGVPNAGRSGAPIRRSTLPCATIAQRDAPIRTKTSTFGSLKPGERRMSCGSAGDW